MNLPEKKHSPTVMSFSLLSIHVFETDLQSTVRVYCHWHEGSGALYAVKGEAVFIWIRDLSPAGRWDRLCQYKPSAWGRGIDGQEFTFLAVVFQPRFLSGTSAWPNPAAVYRTSAGPPRSVFHPRQSGGHALQKNGTGHAGDPKSAGKKRTGLGAAVKSGTSENLAGILQCGRKNGGKTDASTNYRVSRMKEILTCIRMLISGEDLEIAELASQFHMSESAFCRFFKSIMHISAVTYVNNLRICRGGCRHCCFHRGGDQQDCERLRIPEISAILTASSRNACTRRRGSSAVYPQKTVLAI